MDPLFSRILEALAAEFVDLSDEDLAALVDETAETIKAVGDAPEEFIGDGRTPEELLAEMKEGRDALKSAREALKARAESEEGDGAEGEEEGEGDEGGAEPEGEAAAEAAEFAEIQALAAEAEEPEGDEGGDEGSEEGSEEPAATASTAVTRRTNAALIRPARSRAAAPVEAEPARIPLTASAGSGLGVEAGSEMDRMELAKAMIKARERFGRIPPGTKGEQIAIGQYDYRGFYDEDRKLASAGGTGSDSDKVERVVDQDEIMRRFEERRDRAANEGALVASGGLCAPRTPYYDLQVIAMADRPVKNSLPAFAADRGGINAAQPLSLASITTGVGVKTAAQDATGGASAQKTCQVISCPPFVTYDVQIVYHCIQFGNLGARTYPERVAQSNDLVMAALARTAEAQLLTQIGNKCTQVSAATLGLGVVGDLLGQVLTAAAGMRSRHRMSPDAVLRALFPRWLLEQMVSDTIRTQFGRFDMGLNDFVSLLRSFNVEPTFYLDSGSAAGQIFAGQGTAPLNPFPNAVVWYIFPEGSFLFLDGGVLELGIVRDSVLNNTNDFQIFGEAFEAVAFVGVEALQVVSTVCDSGRVSLPVAVTCPTRYGS